MRRKRDLTPWPRATPAQAKHYSIEKTRTTAGYALWKHGVPLDEIMRRVDVRIDAVRVDNVGVGSGIVSTSVDGAEWVNEGGYILSRRVPFQPSRQYSDRSLSTKEREEEVEMRADEARANDADEARETAAVADLRIALAAAGCEAAAIAKLVLHRDRFEEMVAEKVIRFTDPIKAQKVRRAFAAFDQAMKLS